MLRNFASHSSLTFPPEKKQREHTQKKPPESLAIHLNYFFSLFSTRRTAGYGGNRKDSTKKSS